ncbi:MAG: LysM peptidoglycan-binding domain-containing protein [Deltaproteobacteria bacterium]|nr:LysM peptidoglycan-binding domain-containing protein [Deltaproteobacteria bacterium]
MEDDRPLTFRQEEWNPEEEYIEDPGGSNLLYWVGGALLIVVAAVAFFLLGQKQARVTAPLSEPAVDLAALSAEVRSVRDRLARQEAAFSELSRRLEAMENLSAQILEGQRDLAEKVGDLAARAAAPAPTPRAAAPEVKEAAKAAPKPAAAPPRTYTVQRGDTLYSIAKRHNLSVDRLKTLNNLQGNEIVPGQRLKVGE